MSLYYFENALSGGYLQTPNDYFRDLQQAAIDNLFDCTSAKYTIQEQDAIGASTYHDIDVWLDYIVGTTSSGVKNGNDFTQLMFQDIDHETIQGLYYIFDNNYHISYFYNKYDGLEKALAVRRCNNAMKIVDPENGSIFSIPCVIDYDMTSPSQQVSSYIITPNNHATVMVQGNADTLRLFKLNTRYMFGGRPFKLLAYQNALIDDSISPTPTLLYLDLYLDELHANDSIENQLADNGQYQYSIEIDSDDMSLTNGATGSLSASIALNGEEVNRQIVWSSSDNDVVTIDINGNYKVVGTNGQSCTITAILKGNPEISSSIQIDVVETESLQAKIILTPIFDSVRQYDSIDFNIQASYGSQIYTPSTATISLSEEDVVLNNQYLSIVNNQGVCQIKGLKISPEPQILYVNVENESPAFNTQAQFQIDVLSMFG